jgi:hypothetical protein
MRIHARRFGVLMSFTLLAACGGDGGGGTSPVKLSTEADVLREIGNIGVLYLDSAGPAAASASGARQMTRERLQRNPLTAKSVSPKAAETFDCTTSGTTSYEEFVEVSRNLPLFAVSPTVDYTVYIDNNCVESDESGTYRSDGRFEDGSNYNYVGENPFYEYQAFDDASFGYETTGYDFSYGLDGRFESRSTGGSYEERARFRFSFDGTAEGESFFVDYRLGDGDESLIAVDSAESYTIDGPLSYSTSLCEGGRIVYDTLQALTFGSDESGAFINGGQLELTAGSHSVLLTFQADGDVTYSIDGGAPGEITRAELAAVGDECGITYGEG